jgi:hypothetical protein
LSQFFIKLLTLPQKIICFAPSIGTPLLQAGRL